MIRLINPSDEVLRRIHAAHRFGAWVFLAVAVVFVVLRIEPVILWVGLYVLLAFVNWLRARQLKSKIDQVT
jgi:hypothetical protein